MDEWTRTDIDALLGDVSALRGEVAAMRGDLSSLQAQSVELREFGLVAVAAISLACGWAFMIRVMGKGKLWTYARA